MEDVMSKKTVCPVNRAEFRRSAKPISVNIAGIPLVADVKEFSTGSLGWYLNGKVSVEIDGRPVAVQIGMNLTIVGSKELPADEPTTEAA
jgi:S1-C subfamily serine protease